MASLTPFVKRMRVQGGTIFTFSSANEDIGLNINERNTDVKMSYYALINIPSIEAPDTSMANRFNVFAIPGAYQSWLNSGSIKDGRVMVSESFQNYALNLEANLMDSSSYNANTLTSVSERVFWKWLKETGAIRWADPSKGYWQEEVSVDTSLGYNSVVKCIGQISAGAVRSDNYGTYNETYVLAPTSYGQTKVYFKQVEDDNYKHGMRITGGNTNILGRETYTKPHPDALDFKAYYDRMDSDTSIGSVSMTQSITGSVGTYTPGWWWTAEGIATSDNSYFTDTSALANLGVYNTNLKYTGTSTIEFKRSNVDCLSIEFDMDKLKTLPYKPNGTTDALLTFDKMATDYAIDDRFDFNAILLYYSVYNKTSDKLLATNLLGIMFLDAPSGNSTQYPSNPILIPSIAKLQSGPSGFGTSYSFRVNIKSDSMLDDTQAVIYDESTSAQNALENFSEVFSSLEKSVNILNQHTGTINFIAEQYLDISTTQTDTLNQLKDLEYIVNDINRDITGTENVLAMFTSGDDPIGDSSVYMKNGNVGIKTIDPRWGLHVDSSVKVLDLIIENAIRDTSGNILLGYGSPLQIGSSTNNRSVCIYGGSSDPGMTMDSSNFVTIDGSLKIKGNVNIDGSIMNGTTNISNLGNDITNTFNIALTGRDASIYNIYNYGVLPSLYVKKDTLSTTHFGWLNGKLITLSQTDTSAQVEYIETINAIDASIIELRTTKANVTTPMFDGSIAIGKWIIDVDDSSIGFKYLGNKVMQLTTDGELYIARDVHFRHSF
jgi:hypothetical protein